jgi:regulator of ribosome biosynthesis
MGKFDKKIEGEPKSKGVKRKFEANNEVKGEVTTAMDILKRVERGETSKSRKGGAGEEGGVNYRKAVRAEGREQRKSGGRPDGGKGKRGGKR